MSDAYVAPAATNVVLEFVNANESNAYLAAGATVTLDYAATAVDTSNRPHGFGFLILA
jgi:hypothetical protein